MMTRNDVLRELELLPAWQLRMPLADLESLSEVKTAEKIKPEAPVEATKKTEAEFDYFQSENNAWVFIYPASLMDTASQSMLFNNILNALQIKAKKTAINFTETNAKVLIAMGEKTAQTLLNITEPIDTLRGQQLVLHNLPLIVTYSTAEMLDHLPNKAKTWHDLCSALKLVNA